MSLTDIYRHPTYNVAYLDTQAYAQVKSTSTLRRSATTTLLIVYRGTAGLLCHKAVCGYTYLIYIKTDPALSRSISKGKRRSWWSHYYCFPSPPFVFITGRIALEPTPVFRLLRGRFCRFSPVRVTRCTDEGELSSEDGWSTGPQNCNIYEIWEHKRSVWAYTVQNCQAVWAITWRMQTFGLYSIVYFRKRFRSYGEGAEKL